MGLIGFLTVCDIVASLDWIGLVVKVASSLLKNRVDKLFSYSSGLRFYGMKRNHEKKIVIILCDKEENKSWMVGLLRL